MAIEEFCVSPTPSPSSFDFPTGALPESVADMVKEVARTMRVPEALPGCCALTVVSAAVGAGLMLRNGDKLCRGNLYVIAGAQSGTGKTECLRPIIEPFYEFEQKLAEETGKKRLEVRSAKLLLEARIKRIKAQAQRVEDTDPDTFKTLHLELIDLLAKEEQIDDELHEPQLVCSDITEQKLEIKLAKNREVMFSASADAGNALKSLFGKQSGENIYVRAYSGDAGRTDRISRPSVRLKSPCLTLLWLMQPSKLSDLLAQINLAHVGFLPRMMVCQVEAEPSKVDRSVGSILPGVKARWRDLITRLLSGYHQKKPSVIRATEAAVDLLDAHQHRTVDRRREELADADIFAARWNEWAWRLAIVIHAAKFDSDARHDPVDEETADSAVKVAEWFSERQLELLEQSRSSVRSDQEKEVLELLKANQPITARDVQQKRIATTALESSALLKQMEQAGKLTGQDYRPPHGGHSVRRYRRARRL